MKTIPASAIVLMKLDSQFRLTYINSRATDFLGMGPEQYHQTIPLLSSPLMPAAMNRFAEDQLKQKSFVNLFAYYPDDKGRSYWVFADIGKRYTPEEGQFLGYEAVCYPASDAGIAYFEEVFGQMKTLEQRTPGTTGMDLAWACLQQKLQDAGQQTYDELVHTLQHR